MFHRITNITHGEPLRSPRNVIFERNLRFFHDADRALSHSVLSEIAWTYDFQWFRRNRARADSNLLGWRVLEPRLS